MITQSVCCSVIWMESLLLCFGRPGAAPCRCSWVERLYSLQPIWCAHLDAPAVNGPECSPQWHTTYWSMCNPLLITLYCCSGITSQPHFFPTVLALVVNYICALSIIWWVANNWMKIEKIAIVFVLCPSRWPWRKLCQTSDELTMTTGSNINSSSQMTSYWSWLTYWSHPVIMPKTW